MLQLENMRPWEDVQIVIKRHWIVFVFIWLYFLFWVTTSISLFAFFWFQIWLYFVLILFWMMFLVFLYVDWLNHELDMFIITNNRIIGLDQISFLNRNISECNLGQVQEVNAQTKWLLANIFNYWLVTIQTAWNISNFEMSYVPNAIQNSRKILNIVDHYRDANKVTDSINNP